MKNFILLIGLAFLSLPVLYSCQPETPEPITQTKYIYDTVRVVLKDTVRNLVFSEASGERIYFVQTADTLYENSGGTFGKFVFEGMQPNAVRFSRVRVDINMNSLLNIDQFFHTDSMYLKGTGFPDLPLFTQALSTSFVTKEASTEASYGSGEYVLYTRMKEIFPANSSFYFLIQAGFTYERELSPGLIKRVSVSLVITTEDKFNYRYVQLRKK